MNLEIENTYFKHQYGELKQQLEKVLECMDTLSTWAQKPEYVKQQIEDILRDINLTINVCKERAELNG